MMGLYYRTYRKLKYGTFRRLFNKRRACVHCNQPTWRYLKSDIWEDGRVTGELLCTILTRGGLEDMGKRAEYTLGQAVAMVNWIAEQICAHERQCEDCRLAWICADGDYCEEGAPLYSNRLKWLRRCKYAAKREGVKITV